jgi:transglutaminase-like putative cysteine protease
MNAPPLPGPAFLASTAHVDADHPEVVAFAQAVGAGRSPREAAVRLHLVVRDLLRYSPWNVSLVPEGYQASEVLGRVDWRAWLGELEAEEGEPPAKNTAHCIDKALLLAACARALGIPARLHFANVRNHIGTDKLEQRLKTDLMVFHGYTELWLDGRWVATTPAFDRRLCEKLGVAPLAFDGVHDAIFQEFDEGRRFMEYVEDHGAHADLPFDAMIAQWQVHYPHILAAGVWPRPDGR